MRLAIPTRRENPGDSDELWIVTRILNQLQRSALLGQR